MPMGFVWVTNATIAPGPVVNSLNAACDDGLVPNTLLLLSNPKVEHVIDPIRSRAESIIDAYDGDGIDVRTTDLESETDFAEIAAHYHDAIEQARDDGDSVAVDVTPGRKYMSAIAFQAGIQYDADHVFYFHLESTRFSNMSYPEIPRSAVNLIDFTEAFA